MEAEAGASPLSSSIALLDAECDVDSADDCVPSTRVFELTLPELDPDAAAAAAAAAESPSVVDLSPLPSLGELAAFCLPTLGIWLSSPLLSLMDTTVVGLRCDEAQLAALAPSTKLCDYAAFLCTAIAAATTNLAADKLARQQHTAAKRIIAGALFVSLLLGVAIAAILGLGAPTFMSAMLGAASTPQVHSAATAYTAIRALGYPAA